MRFAILACTFSLFLAGPALALDTDPVHTKDASAVSEARPYLVLSRADRWRGAPYLRTEQDRVRREALDKRLVQGSDLSTMPSFVQEDDVLRREALDKLIPVSPFAGGPSAVGF